MIKISIKQTIQQALAKAGLKLIRQSAYQSLIEARDRDKRNRNAIQLLTFLPPDRYAQFLEALPISHSEYGQDLFAITTLGFKKKGFFVEFGATDGISRSNTYLLETYFEWSGILAEPCKSYHKALNENRTAHVDLRCVHKQSGSSLLFHENDHLESSSALPVKPSHSTAQGTIYPVETISLSDLLGLYGAPKQIDFLSVDTEGSELEILNSVDFGEYQFSVITVEHNNNTQLRDGLKLLLSNAGYLRVFKSLSMYDDWYIHSSLVDDFTARSLG